MNSVIYVNFFLFSRISEIVIERFLSGQSILPDWLYNLAKNGREQKKILKQMHSFTLQVILQTPFLVRVMTQFIDLNR